MQLFHLHFFLSEDYDFNENSDGKDTFSMQAYQYHINIILYSMK